MDMLIVLAFYVAGLVTALALSYGVIETVVWYIGYRERRGLARSMRRITQQASVRYHP